MLFASLMNYKRGGASIYLALSSICDQKILKHYWLPLLEKLHSRLAFSNGRFLSWGGRVILINFVMNALSSYYMSMFKLHN